MVFNHDMHNRLPILLNKQDSQTYLENNHYSRKQFRLFLLMNHVLTPAQEIDASISLGIKKIVYFPDDLQSIWRDIPSHFPKIKKYIEPVKNWLISISRKNDYVMIQGDFGACYIMINVSFEKELIPVYATTRRETFETIQKDGSIKIERKFKHIQFRRYEK